jgi:endonuclease YncB( thermonuclease family)
MSPPGGSPAILKADGLALENGVTAADEQRVGKGVFTMNYRWAGRIWFGCVVLLASLLPAFAGDSIFGKITEVRSGEVAVLDYGQGQYTIHIIGIDAAVTPALTEEARQFVSKLVLDKNVQLRFGGRAPNGEMFGQLLTVGDPIKDVGLELVKAGLARRKPGDEHLYGYKYGELSAAEREAQRAKRGLWAQTPPR